MTAPTRCYGCGEPDGSDTCTCEARWGLAGSDRVLAQHRKWMAQRLTDMTAGCDYVDNVRIARTGDPDAEVNYARQVKRGCCGFVDTYVKHKDGTVYKVGFNHGH